MLYVLKQYGIFLNGDQKVFLYSRDCMKPLLRYRNGRVMWSTKHLITTIFFSITFMYDASIANNGG